MPRQRSIFTTAFMSEVHELFITVQKVPIHIACVHLVSGCGMLVLSLFGGKLDVQIMVRL